MENHEDGDDDDGWVDTSNEDMYCGVKIWDEIISPSKEGTNGLYLGRVHFLNRKQEIKDKGIGAILSVIDTPVSLDKEDNITHLHIKLEDDPDEDLFQSFEQTYLFIEENIKKTNVYVHCQMGISRSSTIVLAYLMKKRKMTYPDALEFILTKRDCVRPNSGFVEQLKRYEKILAENTK